MAQSCSRDDCISLLLLSAAARMLPPPPPSSTPSSTLGLLLALSEGPEGALLALSDGRSEGRSGVRSAGASEEATLDARGWCAPGFASGASLARLSMLPLLLRPPAGAGSHEGPDETPPAVIWG